jgi:hypothetical protein
MVLHSKFRNKRYPFVLCSTAYRNNPLELKKPQHFITEAFNICIRFTTASQI